MLELSCERRAAAFMLSACASSCNARAESRKDRDPRCSEYAAQGDCDSRYMWMNSNCWSSCDKLLGDALSQPECVELSSSGGCFSEHGVRSCRLTCMQWLQSSRSLDKEGNCWYWATDGECDTGGLIDTDCRQVWHNGGVRVVTWRLCSSLTRANLASQSCTKLKACSESPESDGCAAPFECPIEKVSRSCARLLRACGASSLAAQPARRSPRLPLSALLG